MQDPVETSRSTDGGAADPRTNGDSLVRGQAISGAGETGGSAQAGLFVIWHNTRRDENRILADLGRHFEVHSVQEVHWSPDLVERNYERFYSDLGVRGVYHLLNKGAGPFLAVRVVDRSPMEEERMTSRGPRSVNGRFLDAKLRYREWLGGLGVHCGETTWESRRDLRMLLGVDEPIEAKANTRSNGDVEVVRRDVTGARGWESAQDAIAALNVGAVYVVIGDPAFSGATSLTGGSRPTQILTDQYHAAYTVLNARPVLGIPPPLGGNFEVTIAGRTVRIGLRVVGDGFLDPEWARKCLAARELGKDGVYRTDAQDALATFCYNAVVHSPRLSAEDLTQAAAMALSLGLVGWSPAELADPSVLKERLDGLMFARGVSYAKPRDPTVFLNHRALGSRWPLADRAIGAANRWWYTLLRGSTGFAKARYLRTRDRMVRRAPALRRLKRALVGPHS